MAVWIVLILMPNADANARTEPELDPVAVWNCLVYGDPVWGQQRAVLVLLPDQRSFWALQSSNKVSGWRAISNWSVNRDILQVADPVMGREFLADLSKTWFGGSWSNGNPGGGWWCSRRADAAAIDPAALRRSSPEFFVPPLVPNVMVSPRYPFEALRGAQEGYAVACFLVDAAGSVHAPAILETSDEIFAATTLEAIERSSYRPTTKTTARRPGCRSYLYELKSID